MATDFADLTEFASRMDDDEVAVARAAETGRLSLAAVIEGTSAANPVRIAGNLTHDASADTLTADLVGTTAAPPSSSVVFLLLPALPRSGDALDLVLNGQQYPLVQFDGADTAARDLTPSSACIVLVRSGEYRVMVPLSPRPQDFDIWHGWFLSAPFGADDIAAGSLFSTNLVTIPAVPAAATSAVLVLGVPADARQVIRYESVSSGTSLPITAVTTITAQVSGVEYRLYSLVGGLNTGVDGREYRVIFGDYA